MTIQDQIKALRAQATDLEARERDAGRTREAVRAEIAALERFALYPGTPEGLTCCCCRERLAANGAVTFKSPVVERGALCARCVETATAILVEARTGAGS